MSELRFKSEHFDFDGFPIGMNVREAAADRAQLIFDKWLASQVVVYATSNKPNDAWTSERLYMGPKAHKAILVNIEPIEKPKPCEHEPIRVSCAEEFGGMGQVKINAIKLECGRCGKRLRPTGWVEVDPA